MLQLRTVFSAVCVKYGGYSALRSERALSVLMYYLSWPSIPQSMDAKIDRQPGQTLPEHHLMSLCLVSLCLQREQSLYTLHAYRQSMGLTPGRIAYPNPAEHP